MRKPVVLITGAGGEIGHGLIARLAERGDRGIVTLDLNRLQPSIGAKVDREITGSILDPFGPPSGTGSAVSTTFTITNGSLSSAVGHLLTYLLVILPLGWWAIKSTFKPASPHNPSSLQTPTTTTAAR